MSVETAIVLGLSIGVLVGTFGSYIVLALWGDRIFQQFDRWFP